MKLPAGSTSIVQVHYTAIGTATTDRTQVGVRYASAKPGVEVHFTALILSVPKYDFNWQTEYVFTQPLTLPKGTNRTDGPG